MRLFTHDENLLIMIQLIRCSLSLLLTIFIAFFTYYTAQENPKHLHCIENVPNANLNQQQQKQQEKITTLQNTHTTNTQKKNQITSYMCGE